MVENLTFEQRANRYADRVISGEIQAGEWTRRACIRHALDLSRQGDEDFPFVFNPLMRDSHGSEYRPGERVCKFIELLPHVKGKWARDRESITLEDWQVFILVSVFGWIHKDTALRRFRTSYLEVARKNAKTTLAAGVGLYLELADDEAGAEVYSCATSADQAKISWNIAKQMVEKSPGMQKRFGVTPHANAIAVQRTASTFQYLSSDHKTLDGLNTHGGIIDEVHAHRTREVYDVMETSTGSREQPLMFNITTAGTNRAGVCYELRTYTVKLLRQAANDETFFGIIYTIDHSEKADEVDDWTDPACWIKANPNLGVSVSLEDLQRKCDKAKTMPGAANNFKTKHLDVWVNADVEWMNMQAWDANADPDLQLEDFIGEDCWLGLDLASKIDIAALILLFKRTIDALDHYYFFGKFYLPEETIYTTPNDQYEGWLNSGVLTGTPGNIIDYSVIEDDIREIADTYRIIDAGYDPHQATQLSTNMTSEGVHMVEMRPLVINFSEPMKEIEALTLTGRLHHTGCPAMNWMISNVVAHLDKKDNIYPNKARFEDKIDGPVGLIMALGRAIKSEIPTESVYETRGIISL